MYFVLVCQKKNLEIRVFYAVRYLPDSFVEKNVLFNKNSIKWYTLRNIATRPSLEDRPTRTESSSNYPIHLLNPRSKAIR